MSPYKTLILRNWVGMEKAVRRYKGKDYPPFTINVTREGNSDMAVYFAGLQGTDRAFYLTTSAALMRE